MHKIYKILCEDIKIMSRMLNNNKNNKLKFLNEILIMKYYKCRDRRCKTCMVNSAQAGITSSGYFTF